MLLIKLISCALYPSYLNIKQNSNIQAQGGDEEKESEAQAFVTGVRQPKNGRGHLEELPRQLGFSGYEDI